MIRDCQRKVDMTTSRIHRLRWYLLLLQRAVVNIPSLWTGEVCIVDRGRSVDPSNMFQQGDMLDGRMLTLLTLTALTMSYILTTSSK